MIFSYLEDFLCWLIGGLLRSVVFGCAANVDAIAVAKSVELAELLVLHEALRDHCLWWGLRSVLECIDRQKLYLRVTWCHCWRNFIVGAGCFHCLPLSIISISALLILSFVRLVGLSMASL